MLIHDNCCYAINSLFDPEGLHVYQVFIFIDFVNALCDKPNVLIFLVPLMELFQVRLM